MVEMVTTSALQAEGPGIKTQWNHFEKEGFAGNRTRATRTLSGYFTTELQSHLHEKDKEKEKLEEKQ